MSTSSSLSPLLMPLLTSDRRPVPPKPHAGSALITPGPSASWTSQPTPTPYHHHHQLMRWRPQNRKATQIPPHSGQWGQRKTVKRHSLVSSLICSRNVTSLTGDSPRQAGRTCFVETGSFGLSSHGCYTCVSRNRELFRLGRAHSKGIGVHSRARVQRCQSLSLPSSLCSCLHLSLAPSGLSTHDGLRDRMPAVQLCVSRSTDR